MLENVKKQLKAFDQEMQKAVAKKEKALAELYEKYKVPAPGKSGYKSPAKGTALAREYAAKYKEIIEAYEDTAREIKRDNIAEIEALLIRARADALVASQKAPSDETLNSIKMLEMIPINEISKEELFAVMECNRNYIAAKAIINIAKRAGIELKAITLSDALRIIERVKRECRKYFDYYDPDGYLTIVTSQGKNAVINHADELLEKFKDGYFITNSNSIEFVEQIKKQAFEAVAADPKSKVDEKVEQLSDEALEKQYQDMSEADKLALYLIN